MTITGLYIGL